MPKQNHEARLIDAMIANGLFMTVPQKETKTIKQIGTLMSYARTATCIVADNVCEYYYAQCEQEQWKITEDIPNILPPAPVTWIETIHPSCIRSTAVGVKPWEDVVPRRWGALLFTNEVEPHRAELYSNSMLAPPKDAKYGIEVFIVTEFTAGEIIGPLAYMRLFARADGSPALTNELVQGAAYPPEWGKVAADALGISHEQFIFEGMLELVKPLLLTLSFMYCKNVHTVEHVPPAQMQRARKARQRPPFITYKTLDIEPFRRLARGKARAGEAEPTGKKAMHLCRAHFKTYTEDKPLFGRRVGTYLWASHVRGDAAVGRVEKTYRVAPVSATPPKQP